LAQKSVIALELVPVLQQDKRDLQASLDKDAQVISNDGAALGKEQAAHFSDKAACTADKNTLKADLDQVKADARKGKIRWFLYGVGAGIGATIAFVLR
jgi:formate-dependent nitrite reductase cytochrome c552 subunit